MSARKKPIEVIKPAIDSIAVPIYSQSRLVVNGWGAKGPSILMGDPEAGVKPRAPRNPEAAFLNALHALDKKSPPKRTGFPACGFKKAMVRASKNMEGMSIDFLRRGLPALADRVVTSTKVYLSQDLYLS